MLPLMKNVKFVSENEILSSSHEGGKKMRTLFEIIDGAKDGNMPTHEECYWAMLALSTLHYIANSKLMQCVSMNISPLKQKIFAENEFKTSQAALNKSPKDFVGWNNDPSNPEYQKLRKSGAKVIDKVLDKKGGAK